MNQRVVLWGIALLAAGLCVSRADENIFGYSYTADVLPRGKWELEQSITTRSGKESGTFLGNDFRTEIERGFTDRLQGSLYLNYNYFYSHDAVGSDGPIDSRDRFGVSGISSEWKYQVLSPYKDRIGATVYLEPGYGTLEESDGSQHQEIELEGKMILEKHWLEDALIGTFNYTLEPEWEQAGNQESFHTHLKMEGDAGAAYRVGPRWYAGLETRVQTEFADANMNRSEFVAAFAGPAVHYAAQRWWATLTVLPQVWGWPNARGTGGMALADHERLEVRLKLGYNF